MTDGSQPQACMTYVDRISSYYVQYYCASLRMRRTRGHESFSLLLKLARDRLKPPVGTPGMVGPLMPDDDTARISAGDGRMTRSPRYCRKSLDSSQTRPTPYPREKGARRFIVSDLIKAGFSRHTRVDRLVPRGGETLGEPSLLEQRLTQSNAACIMMPRIWH